MGVTIGIINSDLIGTKPEPGEHVDWDRPDYDTAEGWRQVFGYSVEEYAERAPHMIVFELSGPGAWVPNVPTTVEEAEAWVRWCETEIGLGWHPDTDGIDFETFSPIGTESLCQCGETFNPSDFQDVEHYERNDGERCGLKGVIVQQWGVSVPLFRDLDVRVRYDDGLAAAHRLLPDIYETSMRILSELHPDLFESGA